MQGLTIDELRSRGATFRHSVGINSCVRCRSNFFPVGIAGSGMEDCLVHLQEIKEFETDSDKTERLYPCCKGKPGSKGCTPTPHLPTYQTIDGKIDPSRVIEYDPTVDLRVGRWMNTRVNMNQLGQESGGLPEPMPKPAASSSSSSFPAPAIVNAQPTVTVNNIPQPLAELGSPVPRVGDEIMVCGQLYHTGTPVILWGDVGGYDHYRVERRYVPFEEADWATTQAEDPTIFTTPNRFGLRKNGLTPAEIEAVRGGQWDLPTLSKQMTQFVLHYDEVGVSQQCFRTLQDQRDLSIHLMCDIDGTIYQALDLKERAWQATTSNTNSVGCEIANIGAYDPTQPTPLGQWYATNAQGQTIITIPPEFGNGGVHTPGFVGSPARPNPITGIIQGQNLIQYDYTPQQYAALQKILATFVSIFPAIPLSYPRDGSGNLIREKLPDSVLATYTGILGHYHIQTNKIDPGPAMQWDVLLEGAKDIVAKSKLEKAILAAGGSPPVSKEQISEWNLMRKMESKLINKAEDCVARCNNHCEYYLIDQSWWSHMQSWLSCTDGSVSRPSGVSNRNLLEPDDRTPLAGLVLGKDYKSIGRDVWLEIVELYGPSVPIIRKKADIYFGVAPSGSFAGVRPAVSCPPSYSAASSISAASPSKSSFVVPEIELGGPDDSWIVVSKRVTQAPGGAK